MAALGASWSATLTTFTQHYGIVVVLDGGTGVGEMPQLSTATGLLQVTAHAPVATGMRRCRSWRRGTRWAWAS